MRSSDYPRNGVVLHQNNQHIVRKFENPIVDIIRTIERISLIPEKISNTLIPDTTGAYQVFMGSNIPKVMNKITKFNSSMKDVLMKINLLSRYFSRSPKQYIDELKRVNNKLIGSIRALYNYVRPDNGKDFFKTEGEANREDFSFVTDRIRHNEYIRTAIRAMFSYSQIYINHMNNIYRSSGR